MGRNHRVSLKSQRLTKGEDLVRSFGAISSLAGSMNQFVLSTRRKMTAQGGIVSLEEGEGGREKNLWQGVYRTHAASSSS